MRNRFLIAGMVVAAGFTGLRASSPKPKNDPTRTEQTDMGSSDQEAAEQSVLPGEPALVEPPPQPPPDAGMTNLQPLPQPETAPSGQTEDDRRKEAEAFRMAKTTAQEQPTMLDLKERAYASKTEREKRVLLAQYARAISTFIGQKFPHLKDDAEAWSYNQLQRLARSRTEPDYQAPVPPANLAKALASGAVSTPTPGAKGNPGIFSGMRH